MDKKKFEKYLEERMQTIQANFDVMKGTILTAGVIVAVSISVKGFEKEVWFGVPFVKIILITTILSMIFLVLSFALAEYIIKRIDKLHVKFEENSFDKFYLNIYLRNEKSGIKKAEKLANFYARELNRYIGWLNNLSTFFLLLSLVAFLIGVINSN